MEPTKSNLASFFILCYKNSVRDKRVVLLFLAGASLILAGFFIGGFSKEESILGNKESLALTNTAKTEILISKVLDGDTIQTSSGERIRYIGINAPEKGEPNSSEATEVNKELVLGRKVYLELDVQKKDRYGRTLAYVFVEDVFINLEIVKNGLAVSETIQPNVKYQNEFVKAQKEARENCLGLWKTLCSD